MTKVIVGKDCGSSPKNIFLKDLTVAFAKGDVQFILSRVTGDIRKIMRRMPGYPEPRWKDNQNQDLRSFT
jgi:hypothetical protein